MARTGSHDEVSEPHRVLWVSKGLARGGAEALIRGIVPLFDANLVEVDVAFVQSSADAHAPHLRQAGIRVYDLGGRRNLEARWPARLARLLRNRRYDLVHTHSPLPAALARIVAPRRTHFFHTEHNLWTSYRSPTRWANGVTLGRNHKVYAVSDGVAASIDLPRSLGRQGTNVETLLHGIPSENVPLGRAAFLRARQRLGIDPERPVIGNVANLSPKKDQAGLLKSFALVQAAVPDAHLAIIGDGPLLNELEGQAATLGIGDATSFLGSRDDVPDLLPGLDVFALSSRYEGLPISLLEAMAAQVACVATSVGGVPEAVRDGINGCLVPPGDPGALADAIVGLLRSPELRERLATAGRQVVVTDYSVTRAVDRYQNDYLLALAR